MVDKVALAVVEEEVHVNSLTKLTADHKNVIFVTIFAGEELLMAVLNGLGGVLEQSVDLLIQHSNHLHVVISTELSQYELTSFHCLVLINPWNDEQIREG